MSYLDTPRLHFSGEFWTDPSTINNATENYNPNEVYNNNPPSSVNPNSVWWNKNGQAFFKVPGCTVKTAVDSKGNPVTGDVIGAQIVGVIEGGPPTPQWARLVDLDPDQQGRSMIVGLKLKLTIPRHPGVSLAGSVRAMTIIDVWGRLQGGGGGGGIESAGCMFQSVMENLEWQGISNQSSPFLNQLYQASPRMLSIKVVVDGYNGDITSDQFNSGRMVGTIGPYSNGEPIHFLAKRRLFSNAEAVAANSPMNNAPFQVSNNALIIDLGNSVPTTQPHGGPFTDLGQVYAVIDPEGQNITLQPPLFTSAAEFQTAYYNAAGIFQLDLGTNGAALSQSPLAIRINPPAQTDGAITGAAAVRLKEGLTVQQGGATVTANPPGSQIALAEFNDGYYVDADFNALRLENGAPAWSTAAQSGTEITSTGEIPIYAMYWGVRFPGLLISITNTPNWYQFPDENGNPYTINNDPISSISWSTQLTTGTDGTAIIVFTGGSLANSQQPARRQYIDGQLYLFDFSYSRYVEMQGVQPITVLLFEDSPVVQNPTWWQDIYPIFYQYAKVYPSMKDLIDLSDYGSVTNQGFDIPGKIQAVLSLPMEHPGFMPVTRDLSLLRREMILTWFKNGMPEGTPPATK